MAKTIRDPEDELHIIGYQSASNGEALGGEEFPDGSGSLDFGEEPKAAPSQAITRAAVAAWQRKAAGRAKDGKKPACRFESPAISPSLYLEVGMKLAVCEGAEDVKRVFSGILARLEDTPAIERVVTPVPTLFEDHTAHIKEQIGQHWQERRRRYEEQYGPLDAPDDDGAI